jgi:hypothetical protein
MSLTYKLSLLSLLVIAAVPSNHRLCYKIQIPNKHVALDSRQPEIMQIAGTRDLPASVTKYVSTTDTLSVSALRLDLS